MINILLHILIDDFNNFHTKYNTYLFNLCKFEILIFKVAYSIQFFNKKINYSHFIH